MLNQRDYNLVAALVAATAELARLEQMLGISNRDDIIDIIDYEVMEANSLISNIWKELNTGVSNA
jgi:hypothetical protein